MSKPPGRIAADAELIAHLETVRFIDIAALGIDYRPGRRIGLKPYERRLLAYAVLFGTLTRRQVDEALRIRRTRAKAVSAE